MARLFFSLFFLILLGSAAYWSLIDQVLEASLMEMDDQVMIGAARGPLSMAAERLQAVEPTDYPRVMQAFEPHFGQLLKLQHIDTLGFSPQDQTQLADTPIFILNLPQTVAFHQVAQGSPWVLSYGPIPEPEGRQTLDTAMSMGWLLFAGLLLLLWIGKLYKESLVLQRAADALGKGRFSTRTGYANKGFMGRLGYTFDQMAAKIEQLLETKHQTVNAVSHELRTPLARLAFAIHFLKEAVPEGSATEVIADIEDGLNHLNGLVAELLKYSHLDFQLSSEPFQVVGFHAWLTTMVHSHQRFDPHLTVDLNETARGLQVAIIPNLMEKAVSNLLVNAETHRCQATLLRLDVKDDHLLICVNDDGPGMSKEQWQQALKPFVRLNDTGNRKQGGWGLGLTLTQKIVAWHQGGFDLGTSEMGGCAFRITLPIHKGPPSAKVKI